MHVVHLMKRSSITVILSMAFFSVYSYAENSSGSGDKYQQFDFWIGKWEVYQTDGKLAGKNRIEREYDGCVIHEPYTTEKGCAGESLNIYDIRRDTWHQTWVDTTGLLLLLEGGMQKDSMVLQGKVQSEKGGWTQHRIS